MLDQVAYCGRVVGKTELINIQINRAAILIGLDFVDQRLNMCIGSLAVEQSQIQFAGEFLHHQLERLIQRWLDDFIEAPNWHFTALYVSRNTLRAGGGFYFGTQ